MPKLESASLVQKISLAQIIDTGNIREKEKYGPNEKGEFPKEIIELANSIKTVGQLQPVILKLAGEVDKIKQYELIAGFRRRAAFQYLCSLGENYNMIDAIIVTGDKLTIQLVENIQREDLTASEREAAIFQLSENGMKQVEIAAQLSKNKSYVSINISAYKMRQAAQKESIDLSGIETSTLAELLSVPNADLISVLRELLRLGGTRSTANILAAKYKKGKDTAPPPQTPVNPSGVKEPPSKIEEPDPLMGGDIPIEPQEPKEPSKPKPPPPQVEPVEVDHRVIDANIILTVIYDYIKDVEKFIRDDNLNATETLRTVRVSQIEAAKDILALIHKRLDNA